MDLLTTIIGLLILALFVFPIVLISRSGRGRTKKFEKDFFSEVSRNGLNISEKSFWNEHALGIDLSANRIIYLDWSGQERVDVIFDLKELKSFEPIPGFAEMNKKNFSFKKVGKLGLKFHFRNSAVNDVFVPFYIPGFGQIGDSEINLFEKWSKLIKFKLDEGHLDNLKNYA